VSTAWRITFSPPTALIPDGIANTAWLAGPFNHLLGGLVALDDVLFYAGGASPNGTPNNDVFRGVVNSTGSIHGEDYAQQEEHLVLPRVFPTLHIIDGTVLVAIGGSDGGSALTSIEVAPILVDGTVGAWTLVGALPSPRTRMLVLNRAEDIVIIGGFTGDTPNDILTTPKSGPDSLVVWTQHATLSTRRNRCGVMPPTTVVCVGASQFDGDAHVIETVNVDDLDAAPVRLADFPFPRADHVAVVVEDRLFVLGGYQDVEPFGYDRSTYWARIAALQAYVRAP
jgi:hypothetical protein